MQKPDGLMILEREQLPDALYNLNPSDVLAVPSRRAEVSEVPVSSV